MTVEQLDQEIRENNNIINTEYNTLYNKTNSLVYYGKKYASGLLNSELLPGYIVGIFALILLFASPFMGILCFFGAGYLISHGLEQGKEKQKQVERVVNDYQRQLNNSYNSNSFYRL